MKTAKKQEQGVRKSRGSALKWWEKPPVVFAIMHSVGLFQQNTVDLLLGQNSTRRVNGTFDDIHEWLNSIARKTQKCIEMKQQKKEKVKSPQQQQQINFQNSHDDVTTGFGGSETIISTSPDGMDGRPLHEILRIDLKNPDEDDGNAEKKKKKKKKVKIVKKVKGQDKSGKKKEKDPDDELYGTGYFEPLVDCTFNLPRVSAQLEKLMGTNVVRLTDRKYMQDLRTRIQEDYNATLQKRIDQREHEERGREMNLILRGSYSPENCPRSLVNLHSIALAREMERERNLIMKGKGEKCPRDLADHPVFVVNQKTNEQISKQRSKLRTTREINAERLIRQGAKWEKEREIYSEMDRLKEIELKKKREAELIMEDEYTRSNDKRGMDLLRIKNRDYAENEMDLKEFMDKEKQKMLQRVGPKFNRDRKKEEPAKIISVTKTESAATEISAKTIESASTSSKHSKKFKMEPAIVLHPSSSQNDIDLVKKEFSDPSKTDLDADDGNLLPESEIIQINEFDFDDDDDGSSQTASITTIDHRTKLLETELEEVQRKHMLEKNEFEKLHYEDPMIAKLKETDDVVELYGLADRIIGGTSGTQPKKI